MHTHLYVFHKPRGPSRCLRIGAYYSSLSFRISLLFLSLNIATVKHLRLAMDIFTNPVIDFFDEILSSCSFHTYALEGQQRRNINNSSSSSMASWSGNSSSRMSLSLLLHTKIPGHFRLPFTLPAACSSGCSSGLLFATQQPVSLPLKQLYQRLLLHQHHPSPGQHQHSEEQQQHSKKQQQQQHERQQRQQSEEQQQREEQQQVEGETGERRVHKRRGASVCVSASNGSFSSRSLESARNSSSFSFRRGRWCSNSNSNLMGALGLPTSSRSGIDAGSRDSSSREDKRWSSRSVRQNRGRSSNSSYSTYGRLAFCNNKSTLSSSSRTRSDAPGRVLAVTEASALQSFSSLFGALLRNVRAAARTTPASTHCFSPVAAAWSSFHYPPTKRKGIAAAAAAPASQSNGDTCLPLLLHLPSFSATVSALSSSRRPLLSLSLLSVCPHLRSAKQHISVAVGADTLHHPGAAASASTALSCVSLSLPSSPCLLRCCGSSLPTAAACFSRSSLGAVPGSRAPAAAAAKTEARRRFSAALSPSSLLSASSAVAASSAGGAAPETPSAAEEQKQQFVLSIEEDRSPVLLENMFSSVEADTSEKFEEEWGASDEEDAVDGDILSSFDNGVNARLPTAAAGAAEQAGSPPLQHAGFLIPSAIRRAFNPAWMKTFTHEEREWKVEAEGRGTRKRAAAHVIIRLGSGQVRVNDDEDLYVRWPYYYNRMDVLQPLYLTNTATVYDVFICARGGGPSGQAAAARLAIGRALVDACPACQPDLEEDLVLYEDLRQRMPKMPGRMKARKTRAWTKR